MGDELIPRTNTNLFRKSAKHHWKHPDPRLATFVYNCSVAGVPAPKIAQMTGVDPRDLKKHYAPELEDAKDNLKGVLMGKAVEMALDEGNEKIMVLLLKGVVGLSDKPKKIEEEKQETKPKLALDTTLLDKNQLKTLHELLSIMQPPDLPSIPGEYREVE